VTERTLAEMGIETAGELAAADRDRLTEALGERGPELSRRAAGDDDRAVTPTGRPKSLSRESALPTTADQATKRETVSTLAADVAHRARERGCLYRTIGIKAVEPPFDVNTRARSLPGPVDDPDLVAEVALDLLGEFDETRVRKLGVRVSNLEFAEADQATLGGFDAGDHGGDRVGDDRDDNDGRSGRGDRAGGGKLTDWVDGPPERGDGDAASEGDDRRRTDDGQASLGDWS